MASCLPAFVGAPLLCHHTPPHRAPHIFASGMCVFSSLQLYISHLSLLCHPHSARAGLPPACLCTTHSAHACMFLQAPALLALFFLSYSLPALWRRKDCCNSLEQHHGCTVLLPSSHLVAWLLEKDCIPLTSLWRRLLHALPMVLHYNFMCTLFYAHLACSAFHLSPAPPYT